MQYQILSVVIMALASYLPRFIPITFLKKKIKSKYVQSFLFYMPYAVLAALTFPAIFFATGSIYTAIIGTAIALILSFFKINLAIVAVVCVAAVFGFGFIL